MASAKRKYTMIGRIEPATTAVRVSNDFFEKNVAISGITTPPQSAKRSMPYGIKPFPNFHPLIDETCIDGNNR